MPGQGLAQDIQVYSEWIAQALSSSGYRVDFTPDSAREIERFLAESADAGNPVPGGLLAEDTGARLFAVGAYVGELIRRTKGGEWVVDDADPQGEINVELHLPDGSVVWPVQRVLKRFYGDATESIAVYVAAL
ncbi:hypothetical protein AB0K02_30460 [Streptomyces sp. NPDC049597]|uniref:hypothetical protein n=1 Tax=Streptomyces sp. NPDC049597 TaxID=3155276 RepID=UPI00342E7DC1